MREPITFQYRVRKFGGDQYDIVGEGWKTYANKYDLQKGDGAIHL